MLKERPLLPENNNKWIYVMAIACMAIMKMKASIFDYLMLLVARFRRSLITTGGLDSEFTDLAVRPKFAIVLHLHKGPYVCNIQCLQVCTGGGFFMESAR